MSREKLSKEIYALRKEVLWTCKILTHEGLMDHLCHVSARLPSGKDIVIRATVPSSEGVKLDHIVVIDLEGNLLDGNHNPPGELFLHTEILRARKDVNCVVHIHPLVCIAFSVAEQKLLPVYNQVAFIDEVPIFENPILITNKDLGSEHAEALGSHNAILIKGHGATVVAENVAEACQRAIYLERAAKIQLMAFLLGKVTSIPRDWAIEYTNEWERMVTDKGWPFFKGFVK